jgi:predicted RNA-binding Zn-ribbon protein involved in translation (DUF1610 family)
LRPNAAIEQLGRSAYSGGYATEEFVMLTGQQSRFSCSTCGARYEVVRVEADSTPVDRDLVCLSCGAPLKSREDQFVLKYFLLQPPHPERTRRAA